MRTLSLSEESSSYHPLEHFYFRTYLNRQAQLPLEIDEEELYECHFEENEEPLPPYLRLERGFSEDLDSSINNAVAKLMLEPIADRLPNFTAVSRKDGSIRSARPPASKAYKSRAVTGLPNFLFKINWATSGPGFSWEESYHVAFLAEYDVYIVTASQDSDDALGFCDVCIGYFESSQDVIYDALSKVKNWWGGKVGEYDADKYESLTSVGSASVDQIDFITAEVWNSERIY
jgi:hypothetical protein